MGTKEISRQEDSNSKEEREVIPLLWSLILLLFLFYGNSIISHTTGMERTLVFYIGQGVLGATLLTSYALHAKTIYGKMVYAFGAVQEALVVICGVAYIVKPTLPTIWENLADSQTGLPVSWLGVVSGLAIALFIYTRELRHG